MPECIDTNNKGELNTHSNDNCTFCILIHVCMGYDACEHTVNHTSYSVYLGLEVFIDCYIATYAVRCGYSKLHKIMILQGPGTRVHL